MLLDVLIAVCAAFAASGVVYGAFRLIRVKPPKWLIPAVAAVAIIGVTAYQRYDWHNRVSAMLAQDAPEMVIVERLRTTVWVEPWSLVEPVISSLVAVDTASIRRNPAHPGLVLVDLVLISRDDDTRIVRHLVDCAARRLAPLPADAVFSDDGLPDGLDWREGAPDRLFEAACAAQ